ncbi:hypothetical protein C8Q77DRAFT_1204805 [Trametes polyzona]|nr:hypothetical protein C8Q77DRAFT_1204805 [Trametes polyzona]
MGRRDWRGEHSRKLSPESTRAVVRCSRTPTSPPPSRPPDHRYQSRPGPRMATAASRICPSISTRSRQSRWPRCRPRVSQKPRTALRQAEPRRLISAECRRTSTVTPPFPSPFPAQTRPMTALTTSSSPSPSPPATTRRPPPRPRP